MFIIRRINLCKTHYHLPAGVIVVVPVAVAIAVVAVAVVAAGVRLYVAVGYKKVN